MLLASAHEWASRSLHSILTPNGYRVLHAYAGYDALLVMGPRITRATG